MKKFDPTEARKRRFTFIRRDIAAVSGRHLPSNNELLMGMSFFSGDLEEDAHEFAERMADRIPLRFPEGILALQALQKLTVTAELPDIRAVELAFTQLDALPSLTRGERGIIRKIYQRLRFYAAVLLDRDAMMNVAGFAISRTKEDVYPDQKQAYAEAALGWLAMSQKGIFWGSVAGSAAEFGSGLIAEILKMAEQKKEVSTKAVSTKEVSAKTQDIEHDIEQEEWPLTPRKAVVVLREVGNDGLAEGPKIKKEFEPILNSPLRLTLKPDLVNTRAALLAEFPHATDVIDTILNDLVPSEIVRLRPTIFLGSPGCGKTTFCVRLFEVLGVKNVTYNCGGVSDSSLIGTARRWSTGEPSLPVSLIKRWQIASPGVVLDEIEKCGTSHHNGNLLDGLLTLLEPETAKAWLDPYLQAEADLSHVLWLATANSPELPGPLKDRCRILPFPDPGPEHLETLASSLLKATILRKGLDARWAMPFNAEEVEALRNHWPGGSIRKLDRLVGAVLNARGRTGRYH